MVDSELDRSILMNSMDFLYSSSSSLTPSSPPSPCSALLRVRPNSTPKAVLPMMSMAMRRESWQKGTQSWSGQAATPSARAST